MDRSLEAVVLIMESFARVARPDKVRTSRQTIAEPLQYLYDIVGHSGDGPEIALVSADAPPKDAHERCAIAPHLCGADVRRQDSGEDVLVQSDGCVGLNV